MPLPENSIVTFGSLSNSTFRYVFMQNYHDYLRLENLTKEKYYKNVVSKIHSDDASPEIDDHVNKALIPNELSTRYTLSVEIKSLLNEKKNLQRELVELTRQLDNGRLLEETVSNNIKRLDELKKQKEETMANHANFLPDKIKSCILSELTCSICYELIFNPITLSCYHTFCLHCIEKWLKRTSKCPVCRMEFSSGNGCMMLRSIIDILLEQILTENEMAERKKTIEKRKSEQYNSLTIIPNFISNNWNLFQTFLRIYNGENEENLLGEFYTDSGSESEMDDINDVMQVLESLSSNNQLNENENISRQSINQNSSPSQSLFQQVSIVWPIINSIRNQRQETSDNVRNLNNQRSNRLNLRTPVQIRRNNTYLNINARTNPYNLRPRNQN